MNDGSPTARVTAAAVLLSACLIAAAVAPGAVAGGFAAGGSETADSDAVGSAALGTDSPGGDDAVAPGLRSANGTVEVVVRFASDARLGADGGGGGDAGGTGGSATLSANDLKTNAASAQADFESFAEGRSAVTVERSFWLANAMLVTVDTDRVPVDRLLDVRGVERVHENFAVELDSAAAAGGADTAAPGALAGATPTPTPKSVSTTSTDATYGVDMVRAPEVWQEFDTRGDGATVAVLDTGINDSHPDLNVSGWAEIDEDGNVIQNDSGPYDSNGHGTHVAGTVAGGNASGRAIGVAPDAKVHAIKVFPGDERSTTFTRIIGGMEASLNESAVGEPADVLQMSLGADGYYSELIGPVRNARDTGAIVVVSSGNVGQGTSSSPGNVHDSLAVGAVDDTRAVASFSSGESVTTDDAWGSDAPSDWPDEYVVPDVSAPGVNVNSSLTGGGYGNKSGTSMAAPHVSGVAALVIASTPQNVSDDELYDILRDTTNHPDNATEPDDRYGTGIVDAFAAVSLAQPDYKVSNLTAQAIVERNATLNATANVTNEGGLSGENRTVELRLTNSTDGTDVTVDETNLSLGAGNTTTVTLNGTVPENFPTGETTVTVASPDDNETAPIRIAEAVGTINGTVTDAETNATLPEIDIIVRNGTETVGETTTGADGTYAVDVPATDLNVTASNATYRQANQTVSLNQSGDTATANFSLALRNGTLSGVVAASDGLDQPSNATVTVTNETNVTVALLDDISGTYAIDLRPGTYDITAEAPDFDQTAETNVTVKANATTDPTLELNPKPATLSGTVTNASDGEPVEGAIVSVGGKSDTSDGDGNYSLTVPRGEYDATATADGYSDATETLALSANGSDKTDFALSPRSVFIVTAPPVGPNEIEQGASGNFGVEIRNDGRAAGDVTVNFSDTATGNQQSTTFSDVGVDENRSATFTISVADDAATGEYDATASTPDGSRTVSFEVVEGESTDGGGGGGTGGPQSGGGGTGGTPTGGDDEQTKDEPTNETDDGEEPIDEPENGTDDEPTDDEPVDDPSEGDDEADESGDDTDGADAGDGDGSEGATGEDGAEDDAPGFGAVVAVLALVALAMLGRRLDGTDR